MRKLLSALALALALMFTNCSTEETQWKQATQKDTIAAYQSFVASHPTSPRLKDAAERIEDLAWRETRTLNTVVAYQRFSTKHPNSAHSSEAQRVIEQLDWASAFSERSKTQLIACISKYPTHANVAKAKEILWEIDWPPMPLDKADCIQIWSKGRGVEFGTHVFQMSGSGSLRETSPPSLKTVVIWRDFGPREVKEATKIGLRAGVAYLQISTGEYKLIRKVDLAKSNDQLAAEFGVR